MKVWRVLVAVLYSLNCTHCTVLDEGVEGVSRQHMRDEGVEGVSRQHMRGEGVEGVSGCTVLTVLHSLYCTG
jgi:hypothetical protein